MRQPAGEKFERELMKLDGGRYSCYSMVMKLRVAFWVAVAFSALAAYAQPHPWLYGPYDKLEPAVSRTTRPFSNLEPPRLKPIAAVVSVPKEAKTTAKSPLLTDRLETFAYRANYFRLATPKSAVK